mgnify:CR=1 FL=1
MKSFIVFSLTLLVLVLGATVVLSLQLNRTVRKSMRTGLSTETILIGDSHAGNIPWDGPAYIMPGSGLLHTFLVIRELVEAQDRQEQLPVLVCPIWPGMFSRHQEGRYNGAFRDKWGAKFGGRLCGLWRAEDWTNNPSPMYLKVQMLLGNFQFRSESTFTRDNECATKPVNPKRLIFDQLNYPHSWFDDALYSKWLFHSINREVAASKATLIWVSTPTHKNFQIDEQVRTKYSDLFATSATANIHHIDLSTMNTFEEGFIDYHHINCLLATEVKKQIDSIVSETLPFHLIDSITPGVTNGAN